MTSCIATIDIGTQSVRAALVSPQGEIRGIAQIQQEVADPHPGWAEQRPAHWWELACRAIRQVMSETGMTADQVAAVSSCGQMHGPVGIDECGNVTTEWVQLWCDKRCLEQCDALRNDRKAAQFEAIAANQINPAWTALKVLWIKQHLPEVYRRTRWFLVPKDFINFRLTGVVATDPSEASGSFLWDAIADGYSPELAAALDLDLGQFPTVRASHEVVGVVTTEAGRATGLKAGTPVVAGGGDFPVALLGLGIVGDGLCADMTGSSSIISTHSPRPVIHPAIHNLRHVVDGWIPFAILDCGGLSMKWCRELVSSACGRDASYDAVIELAQKAPAACDGLLFYPYMLGERRWENVRARGAFHDVLLSHRMEHFVRAVMEGVAFAMALNVRHFGQISIHIEQIRCVGGGARNRMWNQIKADVLQRRLDLAPQVEAGLRGAAILGAAGAGLVSDITTTARDGKPGEIVEPDPRLAEPYRVALARFEALYNRMLGSSLPETDAHASQPGNGSA